MLMDSDISIGLEFSTKFSDLDIVSEGETRDWVFCVFGDWVVWRELTKF